MPEFASFDASGGALPWAAIIRPLAESDVRQVAQFHATREDTPLATSVAHVLGWLENDRCSVLVADHDQQVHLDTPAQPFSMPGRVTAWESPVGT